MAESKTRESNCCCRACWFLEGRYLREEVRECRFQDIRVREWRRWAGIDRMEESTEENGGGLGTCPKGVFGCLGVCRAISSICHQSLVRR